MILALFVLLIALLLPAIVGIITGLIACGQWEEDFHLREKLAEAKRLEDAAEGDRLWELAADQNRDLVMQGIRRCYALSWQRLHAAFALMEGPAVARAWPVAWGATVYGLAGPALGWEQPQPGHLLVLLIAAYVFIRAGDRPIAAGAAA